DTAVGDQRHAAAVRGQAAVDERLPLRHAEAGGHARRAAAAGADADLDAVHAAVEEELRPLHRPDVAGNQLDVAKALPHLADRAVHHDRMPVRDVDDEDVDAGLDQLAGALEIVAGGADGGADAQPSLFVARRERQAPPLDRSAAA